MGNKLFVFLRTRMLSRKAITFLICLFIASFMWLINAINHNYIRTIAIPVRYINLPKDKVLASELPRFFQADIKASGAKIIFLYLKKNLKELTIDVEQWTRKAKGTMVAVPANLLVGNLSRHLNTEIEVLKVKPDSMYFNFGRSFQKMVPVKPDLSLQFEKLYNLTEKVKINPAFITVTGDSALVSNLDSLLTESVVLNKLNKNVQQQAAIILPEDLQNRVALSSEKVTIFFNVDKYTESSLEIPLEYMNVPDGYQLRTFPNKVTVRFQLPMGDFETVTEKSFKAIVDFAGIDKSNPKVKVQIITSPSIVKNCKLFPEKVEYVIRSAK